MEEKYKILIVDDEQSILDMLKLQLEFEGYSVYTAGNAAEALDKLSYSPDIVLLDINMDGMNGLDLCVSIRDFISCPIIFLTARVSEQDKINGLMAGGDDYITKPFSVNELLARISAHLRREQRSHNKTKSKFSEDLIIDYSDRSLYIKGHKIELSNKEFEIIQLFFMEISIEHLNKNYGKQNVLKDISLHIPIGMYGMLGENGAGKTTLMRILATLSEPTTGMVEINGIDIKRKKEIRKIIGYLPQEFSIYPNMTVYSALDYLGILTELPNNIRKRRINELLKQVNLEHEKNKRFKNLSGGMKRRFGIAQALLNDPKILIIDEPTAGLDPEERLRFYNLLSELAVERIILLSTHIASDIEATCSKAAVLSSGTVVFEGQIEKLLQLGNGKVYTTTILQNELNQFKQKYRVISIYQNGINVSCRFLSNAAPKKEWVSCQPTIEDSYMYLLPRL